MMLNRLSLMIQPIYEQTDLAMIDGLVRKKIFETEMKEMLKSKTDKAKQIAQAGPWNPVVLEENLQKVHTLQVSLPS